MSNIVSIVGRSNSGKTTLIEKLVRELKSRNYQVATIKHTHESVKFDKPDKDSWRHIQAGSEATALISPDTVVFIKPTPEADLEKVTSLFGEDYDIILVEGFKDGNTAKIEVHRKEVGTVLENIKGLIAIATDETLETRVKQFSLEDFKGIADLLEKEIIKPQKERVSLYINNMPVPLIEFPMQIISNVAMAIANCLKGVGEIGSLKIFVKREQKRV